MKISATCVAACCILIVLIPNCPQSPADQEDRALYEIKENGKWGFINRQGEVVVEPQFDRVVGADDDAITARNAAGWIAIHPNNENQAVLTKLPFGATYRSVIEIAPDLYRVVTADGTATVFDAKGRFGAEFDDDWYFGTLREGLLPIKQGGKWGVVDRLGRVVLKPTFDFMGNFSEGKAPVSIGKKWGYIDFKGDMIIKPQFRVAGTFVGGIALVHDGKEFSYIRPDGTAAFEANFPVAGPFSNGRAIVANSSEGLRGYIDQSGKYAIEPKYTRARNFSDGLAAVEYTRFSGRKREKVAGYIDPHGKLVIRVRNPIVLSIAGGLYKFRHGLALVGTNEGMGYLDKRGNWVWRTKKLWIPSWNLLLLD